MAVKYFVTNINIVLPPDQSAKEAAILAYLNNVEAGIIEKLKTDFPKIFGFDPVVYLNGK